MLIDKSGKIAFKGHPASRANLEEDLDALRRGEALSGEGTAPKEVKTGDDDEAVSASNVEETLPEGYSEDKNPESLRAEIRTVSDAIAELVLMEDVKKCGKDMSRAFCVLVVDQQYIPSTQKIRVKYENYRALAGQIEQIEEMKEYIENAI